MCMRENLSANISNSGKLALPIIANAFLFPSLEAKLYHTLANKFRSFRNVKQLTCVM